ncbi:MAG: cob(I)yrinic acid a,c-diamide adenosyltransferase [Bacteroidales bacterium]|nr:cob(I)yrinic acid a,c-diamide adenosyltransferase [Bacteroidales bacterium]
MAWKIYTKKGDGGETSLIGGTRVPKYHDQVEAYGTVDELKSYIGLIRDQIEEEELSTILMNIQQCLFIAESRIAVDSTEALQKMPNLKVEDIELLEDQIDQMNESLPELTSFILPGGHILASHTHVARTICRRAERSTLKAYLNSTEDELVLKYLNRLSDYLFVLARKFANELGNGDIVWSGEG